MEIKAQSFSEDKDTTGLSLVQKGPHLEMEGSAQIGMLDQPGMGVGMFWAEEPSFIQWAFINCLLMLITV